MKKILALLTVLALAVTMFAGCGGDTANTADNGTIAVVAKGESHAFWQSVKAGAEAAGEKYGYKISEKKMKYYTKAYPKLITGVIIGKDGNPTLRNSMRLNILHEFKQLQFNPEDEQCRKRLRGLLTAARQINKNAFPTIYKFAFSKNQQ